tara:strand:- start:1727 stop:2185 length:459 start_codon:yes stop_codon:yes gene_type:complete
MIASNEEETKKIANKLAKDINNTNATICLNGDLGSGKTTFSRYLIRSLLSKNINDDIPSPTFTLLQIYEDQKKSIYHYDFYRLNKIDELIELNYGESVENNICIIEWANKFKKALPPNRIEINFEIKSNNKRSITFDLLGLYNKKNYLWMQE